MEVKFVKKPKIEGINFNEKPLHPSYMHMLPAGAIKPRGFLKSQLELMANGMFGRLDEISKFLEYGEDGWINPDSESGWEEQAYWFRGYYLMAIQLQDEKLLERAYKYINGIKNSVCEDGYFGPPAIKEVYGRNGEKSCDVWPQILMMDALIYHYEYTSETWVLEVLLNFLRFCYKLGNDLAVKKSPELSWKFTIQAKRLGEMLRAVYYVYNIKKEDFLLELATRIYHKSNVDHKPEWLNEHIVNFTQQFKYMAMYYPVSGQDWHMDSAEYWYNQHLGTWGQQPRGIFAADERVRSGKTDPRQGFETCGFIEFAKSFAALAEITGDPIYADRCEDIMFNHFPASCTPDMKGLHYLTASNMPQLDDQKVPNQDFFNGQSPQLSYSASRYRCCQHNTSSSWPMFIQQIAYATADNGVAIYAYGASEIDAKTIAGENIKLGIETNYPFKGNVKITIDESLQFPLYLRVPRWSKGFYVKLNGEEIYNTCEVKGFVLINRHWQAGDKIEIQMDMEISTTRWPRNGSVTIDRGPMSYSIKIKEKWVRKEIENQKLSDFPDWEVFPESAWNYGLLMDEDSIRQWSVKEKNVDQHQPWTVENAPIIINVPAKKIDDWQIENETHNVPPLEISPIISYNPVEIIEMIPLGCARLRIACLPVVAESPDSRAWNKSTNENKEKHETHFPEESKK